MTTIVTAIIVGWVMFAAGAVVAIVWLNQQDDG